jgi:hypothetical protein
VTNTYSGRALSFDKTGTRARTLLRKATQLSNALAAELRSAAKQLNKLG